jgi:nickel/cobalt exporter
MRTGSWASTGQVILFGLTGGLIPCSAAVSVLLICLQQQRVLFGVSLVGAFTAGLALMLIAIGILAPMGMKKAGNATLIQPVMRHAPFASGVILAVVGLGMIDNGLILFGV